MYTQSGVNSSSVQEGHLQKLLNQPELNYVALNRAAAHDPYAFSQAPLPDMASMDAEAILTTALSRVPATLVHACLSEGDLQRDPQPQNGSRGEPSPVIPKSTLNMPHMSYNVAKLLEQREDSPSAPKTRLDVLSRTHACPGCGGSPTAMYASAATPCWPWLYDRLSQWLRSSAQAGLPSSSGGASCKASTAHAACTQ